MGKTAHTNPGCPSDETMAALLGGGLDEQQLGDLYQHSDDCNSCRDLLIGLARAQRVARDADAETEGPRGSGPVLDSRSIEPGTRLDQYRVAELVGEGGMGRVYAAEDEALGRRVAIKAVRPRAGTAEQELTVRLVREAQAMAQLSHPNVLTVYSVGTHASEVYFAMEFVDGVTLGEWLRRQRRPWSAVLRTFIAAGKGLAAAHHAGLVHRDFKPANVLVAGDGRVLVTDFGLVAQLDEPLEPASDPELTPSWEDGLTKSGATLGTPAYMAPEQFGGTVADARADQFSFCVALAEGLFDRHPFGRNVGARIYDRPWRPEVPTRPRVPAALRRALQRGLARDPDERFASMDDLLRELNSVARRRRNLGWLAFAAVLAGAGGYLGAEFGGGAAPCPRGEPGVVPGAWDDARRSRVHAHLQGIDPEAATRTLSALDGYAHRWQSQSHDACEATRVRAEVSEEVLDAKMACLDDRKRALAGVAEVLASSPEVSEAGALRAAYRLPSLEPCTNLKLLRYRDRPTPDPEKVEVLDATQSQVWRAQALVMAGADEAAIRMLDALIPTVDALGHRPLQAEARLALATAIEVSDSQRSETLLREAYQLAMTSHADEIASAIANSLAQRAAFSRGDPYVAQLWLDLARSHAQRSGLGREWSIEFAAGAVARAAGDREAALAHFERAGEGAERGGAPPDQVANAFANAASLAVALGKKDASARLERVVVELTTAFGPNDSRTLGMVANIATGKIMAGDLEGAEVALRNVLTRQRRTLGDEHEQVATSLANLGQVYRRTGRPALALEVDREAAELRRSIFGERSLMHATSLRSLAKDRSASGDLATAVSILQTAVAIMDEELGAAHVQVIQVRGELAGTLRENGRLDEAEAAAKKAVEALEPDATPDERVATALLEHGLVALAKKDKKTARAALTRARSMTTPASTPETVEAIADGLLRAND